MTSCRAVMASVAMADTRAWSTVPALRSFWAKRSVALRPEPAAVGLGTVAVMVISSVGADGGVRRRPPCRAPPRPRLGSHPEPAKGGEDGALLWWGGREVPHR